VFPAQESIPPKTARPLRSSEIQNAIPLHAVEAAFRAHAGDLDGKAKQTAGCRVLAIDGKTLRGSLDAFHDSAAKQVLSAFAADTMLILAHIEIDAKSNEIPAAQQLLAELDVAGRIVTLDALHAQKNI